MLTVLERECLDLSDAIENVSEKQELLATLMESKKNLEKDALEKDFKIRSSKSWWSWTLELLGRKHKLGTLMKERERAGRCRGKSCQWQKEDTSSFSLSVKPGAEEGRNVSAL